MAGRQEKYTTNIEPNFDIILGYLRSGFQEYAIAKRLGIANSTWEKYKSIHKEFKELLFKGHQDVAAMAVNTLVKRALGFDYEETHIEIRDSGSEKGKDKRLQPRVIKKITKHMPPDVGAICVILFNRMGNRWKNKQEVRHSGQIKNSGVLLTGVPLDKEAWMQFYKDNVENYQKANEKEAE